MNIAHFNRWFKYALSSRYWIYQRLFICASTLAFSQLAWGNAKNNDSAILTVWLDVFIANDLSMVKKQHIMTGWVVALDVERQLIPEINRIWQPAVITFKARHVPAVASLAHPKK